MQNLTMQNWLMIALVALAFVVMAAIWVYTHRKRTETLRGHFGPEYDRTVLEFGNRSSAERDLVERRKKLSQRDIRPLTNDEVNRLSEEWWTLQTRFVDDPKSAVMAADRLVTAVLKLRGYQADDLIARLADVSVAYPAAVERYRLACNIVNQSAEMTTEDLRKAIVLYRNLFDELFKDRETRRTA